MKFPHCASHNGAQDAATWHPLNLTMAAKIRSNDAIAHDVKKTVTWQVWACMNGISQGMNGIKCWKVMFGFQTLEWATFRGVSKMFLIFAIFCHFHKRSTFWGTVWRFQNVTATQNLCEIKFGKIWASKTAIFAVLGVKYFDFWKISASMNYKKWPKSNIRAIKTVKIAIFGYVTWSKIDFT